MSRVAPFRKIPVPTLVLLFAATALGAVGCGGPRCGDGKIDPGETATTCCADAGCQRGVCDEKNNLCVDAWALGCQAASTACSTTEPGYQCSASGPPAWSCASCGCGEGAVCDADGLCSPPELADLERDNRGISIDLEIDEYFAFFDAQATLPALSYTELVNELDARLRADGRRMALLLGESHGSTDEQAVGMQALFDLNGLGWRFFDLGIEGGKSPLIDVKPLAAKGLALQTTALFGDLTNNAYCKAATNAVKDKLNSDGSLYVQYTGSGHTSRETCWHPENYYICQPPHTAECVLLTGRKALVVMLFDPDPWLTMTDNALLWRAGKLLPDVTKFSTELDASLAAWDTHLALHTADPRFDTQVMDASVNVRLVPAQHAEDTFVAFFPRPGRVPNLMRTFKAVWSDPAGQSFLVANGLRPQDCSIGWNLTPGEESYSMSCGKQGGPELTATLDKSFAITSLETT